MATAAVLALALVVNDRPGTAAQGSESRNVLVVMTDDQRLSDLARAMPRTRKRIGKQGVIFRKAYATFPLCCPSRATYLTGQYAHNHGVVSNGPPDGGAQNFDDSATTAVALNAAGYRTGYTGKYLNGYRPLAEQDPPYVPPGWDWWRAASLYARMLTWQQMVGGRIKKWGHGRRDYQTDVLARQATRFLKSSARRSQPFFLTIAPLAPHVENPRRPAGDDPRAARRHRDRFRKTPLPRPPSFNEADVSDKPSSVRARPRLDRSQRRYLRDLNRDRLRSLLAVDEMVVTVLRTLRKAGLTDDTLVIFTSDNGFQLGEHRLEGKTRVYEPAIQVPLLMRGPGIRQRAIGAPVGNVDLAATIYDWTGVPPALDQDGVSLLDVAAAPAAFDDRELLLQVFNGAGLRTRDWLYAEHGTSPGTEVELYDAQADPHQLQSLHDSPAHAAVRGELAARLADLRDCAGAECH